MQALFRLAVGNRMLESRKRLFKYIRAVIMRYSLEVYGNNAIMDWSCLSVRLSVRMIQLENHSTGFDVIWYGCCAIRDYLKVVL
jgi:hypothetical protein